MTNQIKHNIRQEIKNLLGVLNLYPDLIVGDPGPCMAEWLRISWWPRVKILENKETS